MHIPTLSLMIHSFLYSLHHLLHYRLFTVPYFSVKSYMPIVELDGPPLPRFARIERPRWRPVELNDRHLRFHGKIGDCEQSNCTIAPSRCEISDDVLVLIWKCHAINTAINKQLPSLTCKSQNLICLCYE